MGSLEIIMGPMFSGKTELLIEKYLKIKEENPKFLCKAFNYYKDTRYGNNMIVSHNGKSINSINIKNLNEILTNQEQLSNTSYVFINEAQFFPELKNIVVKLIEDYNKNVIICGLDSDYKREKFGEMWDLIPYADYIVKLKGKCNNCSNPSIFTYRITNEKEQEVIGSDNYIPVCRNCYYILEKNN